MTERIRNTGAQAVESVSDAARQIWLAGLGAFVRTGQEGTKLFTSLVKEGEKFQGRSKDVAGEHVSHVVDQATGQWDRLEKVFEDRVARALGKIGVPSKDEVEALNKRIAKLQASVDALSKPKKPTAKRPAAKRSQTGAQGTA